MLYSKSDEKPLGDINQRKHDLLYVSATVWKVRVRHRETSNSGSIITYE